MRIWHLNIGNHAGAVDGVAVMSERLAASQAAAGHDVTVWTTGPHAGEPASGGAVRRHHTTDREAWRTALRQLRSEPPDVVHLHSVFRPVHDLVGAAARRRGAAVVRTPHGGLSGPGLQRDRRRKELYGRLVERRGLRRADGVVALQRLEADDIRRYSRRAGPIEVIANAAAPDVATGGWVGPGPGSGPRVVMLSRYDVYQKGLDRAVAIAAELPGVELRVHGSADKNDPEAAAALVASAPAGVRFLPPVSGDDKLEVLASASMFLQPSRFEGLSLALVEALSMGVPCGVSRYVDDTLGLRDAGAALVLDDDDEAAAVQIREVLDDPARARELGAAGLRFAIDRFDLDAVTEAHLGLYRSAAATTSSVGSVGR